MEARLPLTYKTARMKFLYSRTKYFSTELFSQDYREEELGDIAQAVLSLHMSNMFVCIEDGGHLSCEYTLVNIQLFLTPN